MSVIIHVEDFPNMLAILQELERQEKQKSLNIVQPVTEEIRNQERKPTLIAVKQLEPIKRCERLLCEDKLTPAAKTLNDEQLALIYEDILKPLDFASILHERRKLADSKKEQWASPVYRTVQLSTVLFPSYYREHDSSTQENCCPS